MGWFQKLKGTPTTDGRPADRARDEALVPPVDFLVVGCMKCGTTTLRRVLSAHPDVHLPERELHFFGNHERYLSAWKHGRLDPAKLDELYGQHYATKKPVLGGKTPNYIVSSLTVERIHRFHPDAKLVVMVRDPIARAESHWNHLLRQKRNGKIPGRVVKETFEEHLDANLAEIEQAWRPDVEIRHTNVVYRGMYARQIRRLHHFFPPERVHVGVLDDLKADPEAFFGALFDYLGVPMHAPALDESRPQPSQGDAERQRLSADARRRLADVYAEPVADLEALLDRKLPGWLRA